MILMVLGYLMVTTFMVLIMTKRLSAIAALVIVPVIFGLLAGHGTDLGEMAVGGISDLAPTATLLVCAVLYFAVMIDTGLFDPLVNAVLKFAGEDPVKVTLGTAILTAVVALDGDGTTTTLIVITAFLPLYLRLGMNPLIVCVILSGITSTMNLSPWGGPLGRSAAALHVDPSDLFIPLLPTIAGGVAAVFLAAWYFGRKERVRLAAGKQHVFVSTEAVMSFERDDALLRPDRFVFNLLLTLLILVAAVTGMLPLAFVFILGLAIALVINYPKVSEQTARIQAHAKNALQIVLLILSAGLFTGIMKGTGMIDAMAQGAAALVPDALGSWMGVVMAVLAIPLNFVLSNEAYYFGVLPIMAETAALHGVSHEAMGRAALLGLPVHSYSPLVAAIYVKAQLLGTDIGAIQRFGLKWGVLFSLNLTAISILTGVIL